MKEEKNKENQGKKVIEENQEFQETQGDVSEAQSTAPVKEELGKGIPMKIIAASAIVVLLIVVLAAITFWPLAQDNPDEGDNQVAEPSVIKGTRLFDSTCADCIKETYIEVELFSEGIEFEFEDVDAQSEQGKKLVAKYGINALPALLIEPLSIPRDQTIVVTELPVNLRSLLEEKAVGDMYVIEQERDRFEQSWLVTMSYLESPNPVCALGDKPKIQLISEPYCAGCITMAYDSRRIYELFAEEADLEYLYYPAKAQDYYQVKGQAKVDAAANYLMCSIEQESFSKFKKEMIDAYCDKDVDGNASETELVYCHVGNPKYGTVLDTGLLDAAVVNSGLDMKMMRECIKDAPFESGKGALIAPYYGIGKESLIPVVVVDCRYITHISNAWNLICDLHPELSGCS